MSDETKAHIVNMLDRLSEDDLAMVEYLIEIVSKSPRFSSGRRGACGVCGEVYGCTNPNYR